MRGPYRRYHVTQKEEFWHLVIEQGCSAYRAAKIMGIKLQTAYTWKRNWNQRIVNEINGIHVVPKKRGRKPLLTEDHKHFLEDFINQDPTVTLETMVDTLKEKYSDARATVPAVHRKSEELTPRIREATSEITVESYEGFCSHAREHIQPCLKRESF
ncbi:hypothetical protein JA1_005107 [Spathaspora sp. JA1]|nr:hypothetical protein JA1_005107 [Spathaspora sp. JA1]